MGKKESYTLEPLDVKCPVADTEYGKVQGDAVYAKPDSKPIFVYLGIPYASPPVGKNRFAAPKPPTRWSGVQSAKTFEVSTPLQPWKITQHNGLPCPQNLEAYSADFHPIPCPHTQTSESCLTLNIYTTGTEGKRAVLVAIHGGDFRVGSGGMFGGTALAMYHDLVVVTFNYRIGPFGFLSTGDEHLPGNVGIQDQQMLLKWVQKNINKFGGDPKFVTVYGQGSGAACVGAHIMSPLSKGLFKRAISHSGSILAPNTINKEPKQYTKALATALGCTSDDSKTIVDFLQTKDAADLVSYAEKLPDSIRLGLVVDGTIITAPPLELYKSGKFNNVDHMIGVNSHEGLFFCGSHCPDIAKNEFSLGAFNDGLRSCLQPYFGNNTNSVLDLVSSFYNIEGSVLENSEQMKQKLCEIVGEALVMAPSFKMATLHCESVCKTYFHEYVHRPSFSQKAPWADGADHTDEILFTWADPLMSSPITADVTFKDEEIKFCQMYTKYLSNFIGAAEPNSSGSEIWPDITPSYYLHMKMSQHPSRERNFRARNMEFWNDTVAKICV